MRFEIITRITICIGLLHPALGSNAKLKVRESFYQYHHDTHTVLVDEGRSKGNNNLIKTPNVINYPYIDLKSSGILEHSHIRIWSSGDYKPHFDAANEIAFATAAVFALNGNIDSRDNQGNRFNVRDNRTISVRSLAKLGLGPTTNYLSIGSVNTSVTSDVPHDFSVGLSSNSQGIIVRVPPGGNCLFGALLDSTYPDNRDPNGNARIYAANISNIERPRFRFTHSSFAGNESNTSAHGNGKVTIVIERYQNTSITSVVNFRTVENSGTAVSSEDYISEPWREITFNPNETQKSITIELCKDDIYERQESFKFEIGINYDNNPNEAYINTPNPAYDATNYSDSQAVTVFINNTTPKPVVRFATLFDQITENAGSIPVRITLERSVLGFDSDGFWLGRIHETSSASDIQWQPGPHMFVSAEASEAIYHVPLVDDNEAEGTEVITFHLGGLDYLDTAVAGIGNPAGHLRVMILDDEDLSDPTQSFSTTPPPQFEGFLFIQTEPSDILAGWRFQGEQIWRAPGIPVTNLVSGDRTIEFRPVPGFIHPPSRLVSISSGEATPVISAQYYLNSDEGQGTLGVRLEPSNIAELSVAENRRAQWRFLQPTGAAPSPDNPWRNSGELVSGLTPGTYLIECKDVPGRTTPLPASVSVTHTTPTLALTYFLPDAPSGNPPGEPAVVPYEITSTAEDRPYHFCGQIRTSLGSASGFAIKPRVVLTAAHALFDEAKLALPVPDRELSVLNPIQWLPQRDRGSFEPVPIIPRGVIIQTGYEAQRISEGTPGEFSPESRVFDVAALYFDTDAARGSFSGWLASLDDPNEWMTGSSEKTLVGYPVLGIPKTNIGRMHATPIADLPFTKLAAPYPQLYRTTAIRSYPGNSGGPLCVKHQDKFVPAAIYLGGETEAIVRTFDLPLTRLIGEAILKAEDPSNGNVGAGFSLTSVNPFGAPQDSSLLRIVIEPAEAIENGAGWRLNPETTFRTSDSSIGNLNAGTYQIEFTPIDGFTTPTLQNVTLTGGNASTFTFTYEAPASEIETWRQTHFGSTSNSGIAADTFDADKDGQTNHSEFIAGTDPKNPNDKFEVNSILRSGTIVILTYDAKANRRYSLEKIKLRADGSHLNWLPVKSTSKAGADEVNRTIYDTNPTSTAFYRLKVTYP